MRKNSSVRLIGFLAAAIVVAACGEHASPTAPAANSLAVMLSKGPPAPKGKSQGPQAPQGQQGQHGPHVAQCVIPYDIDVSARIGPLGGKLDLGDNNTIVFPAGALLTDTTITAHVPKGNVAKVDFTPEGIHFLVPAVVTLNYSACITPTSALTIVYLQADTVAEVEPSTSDPKARTLTALIYHFSSYAVAY
jgi:hypothetical protein